MPPRSWLGLLGLLLASCSHASTLEAPAGEAGAPALTDAAALPDGPGAAPDAADPVCVAWCTHIPAACPAPECVPKCDHDIRSEHCGTLVRALLTCWSEHASELTCVHDQPFLPATICGDRFAPVARCLNAESAPP